MSVTYDALFLHLLEDLSDHLPRSVSSVESLAQIEPWPDMTLKQFRSLHLAKSFLKKLEVATSENANAVALEKFLQCNVRCRDWSLRLESSVDEQLIGDFRNEVYRFWMKTGDSSLVESVSQLLAEGNTGPGVSIGADGTDFYTKMFSSNLTGTAKRLYLMYRHHSSFDATWNRAEMHRSEKYVEEVVEGNSLSFVPKNVDTSRVICTEPLLNMFYQQGMKCILTRRLKSYFGIDLANQQVFNRELARVGSRDDSFSTIDLSSASDTVSLSMIETLFPRDFTAWLKLIRSPKVKLPSGSLEDLHMMSSMGNAFTFPLETLIFSCVVSSVYKALDIRLDRPVSDRNHPTYQVGRRAWLQQDFSPPNSSDNLVIKRLGNFGVFGDDIIIEKRAYALCVRLLKLLGFSVNAEKSFQEGPFRESCGGDYYNGHLVRGVFVKKNLALHENRFNIINRLNAWSAVSGLPLVSTVRYLTRLGKNSFVPLAENDDAGIKVPLDLLKKITRRHSDRAVIYRRFGPRRKVLRIQDGFILGPKGAKTRDYNPHGLLLAFLRGDVVNSGINIRAKAGMLVPYRWNVAATPNWDWLPTTDANASVGFRRLATAIAINLNLD